MLDGSNNYLSPEAVPVRYHAGGVSDIYKELLLTSASLLQRLCTDNLTNLRSETFIIDYSQMLMESADLFYKAGEKTPVTLFYIDVNDFKAINDEKGHEAGDILLAQVGKVIKDSIRTSDYMSASDSFADQAGRPHGDEFVVLVPDINSSKDLIMSDYERAEIIKNRIKSKVYEETGINLSIGYSFYVSGEDYKSFVSRADKQMYEDKKAGKVISSQ